MNVGEDTERKKYLVLHIKKRTARDVVTEKYHPLYSRYYNNLIDTYFQDDEGYIYSLTIVAKLQ